MRGVHSIVLIVMYIRSNYLLQQTQMSVSHTMNKRKKVQITRRIKTTKYNFNLI